MKVIVAGFPKTGTKSMQDALKELDYNVYDLMENFMFLEKEWQKVCKKGATTEDFRRMFENVDAVTDIPACYFWDEIHKAFPDAKIILTLRDEESWSESLKNQKSKAKNMVIVLGCYLSPTLWRFSKFAMMLGKTIFGEDLHFSLFKQFEPNSMMQLVRFRRHNSHVLQTAPKDKLLIFDVKDGWGPLCEFLGKDIPDKPFPHKNVQGEIVKDMLANHPVFIRAMRELMFSAVCLSMTALYGVYKLVQNPSIFSSCGDVVVEYFNLFKFW